VPAPFSSGGKGMVAMARTLPLLFRTRHGRREKYDEDKYEQQPSPRLDLHCERHWHFTVSIHELILLLP